MTFVNQQFSKDLRKITSKKLFDDSTIKTLSRFVDKTIVEKLKKEKSNSHRTAFNRQTVNQETLVKNNMLLAVKIANHYFEVSGAKRKRKCEIDDVVQEAMYGLSIAAKKYIDTKNGKYRDWSFGPYAKQWIRKYVTEFINNKTNPVKLTVFEAATNVLQHNTFTSIDAFYDTGEKNITNGIFNEIVDEDTQDRILELRDDIDRRDTLFERLLSYLSEVEYLVITMTIGLNADRQCYTTREIGKVVRCTKIKVQEIYTESLNKLRDSDFTKEDFEELSKLSSVKMTKSEFALKYSSLAPNSWLALISKTKHEFVQNSKLVNYLKAQINSDYALVLLNLPIITIKEHIAKYSK